MNEEEKKCSNSACDKPARVAIKTSRPKRELIKTTVWWDERVDVPKSAQLHCKEHGIATLNGLAMTLIDEG